MADELRKFSQRLNEALDRAGYPPKHQGRQVSLGRDFGVSQKGAQKWLEGAGYPRIETLNAICSRFGIDLNWLLRGVEDDECYDVRMSEQDLEGFAKRLNLLLDEAGYPQKNEGRQSLVAREFGVSQVAARKWLQGENYPRFYVISALCERLNTSLDWLVRGVESNGANLSPLQVQDSASHYLFYAADYSLIPVSDGSLDENNELHLSRGESGEFVKITLPRQWFPKTDGYIAAEVRVAVHPHTPRGFSIALIDTTKNSHLTEGALYAVAGPRAFILRRISRVPGSNLLRLVYEAGPGQSQIDEREENAVKILGQVVWLGHWI